MGPEPCVLWRTVLKVLEPGMELLLFRLGERGYASYDPAVCVPEAIRPSGYVTASFQALGASWLPIDWNAIRLPTGITAPR